MTKDVKSPSKPNIGKLLELWRDNTISKDDMVVLWGLVQSFVAGTANSHFKKRQGKGYKYEKGVRKSYYTCPSLHTENLANQYEKNQTRILWFFQFVKENSHKSTAWCITSWRIRKAWVELLIEAHIYGVSLYPDDMPISKQIGKATTRKLVEAKGLIRKECIKPDNFTKLEEIYREKYPTKSITTVKKFVDVYIQYHKALHAARYKRRNTKCSPKRNVNPEL